MLRRAALAIAFTLTLGYALILVWPSSHAESHVQGRITSIPTATPTLPMCTHEDGSGQGLCMWDADTHGNAQGNDVVSGMCAMSNTPIITDEALSTLCMRVWNIEPYTRVVSEDGATESWDGPSMVDYCTDREMLIENGWNTRECLTEMVNEFD